MQIDPFFQVPQHPVHTSVGMVNLPVMFKEGDYSLALFGTRRERVEALLEDTSFVPAMTLGPFALVALVMANFNICSEAPYSIAASAVPVSRRDGFQPISPWRELFNRPDQRHMGFYQLNCPINNLRMMSVGAEVWGHPKTPADIHFELNRDSMNCSVHCMHENRPLMQFAGRGRRFWRIAPMGFNIFSIRNQQVIRSILDTRSPYNVHLPFGYRLTLGDCDHPAINPLRQLGLDGKRPLVLLSSDQFQGRFNEGTVIEEMGEQRRVAAPIRAAATLKV